MICLKKTVPGQWLLSKIAPVHKKGDRVVIENYRPVANLYSVSKIFEKFLLNRINELEIKSGTEIADKQADCVLVMSPIITQTLTMMPFN